MNLAEPAWLLAFPAALLIVLLARVAGRRNRERRLRLLIASPALRAELARSPDPGPDRTALFLFAGGCLFLAVALARPYLPSAKTSVQRLGVDVFIGIDLSRSMDAEDVRPRRLDAAKAAITNFVGRLAGDRVSLIAFSGEARIVAPLTFDGAALGLVLKYLETRSIGKGGTSLTAAIELAADKARQKELDSCALILVTDGEDLEGDPILTARQLRERQGLRLFTVGVGTAAGAKVPMRDGRGRVRGNAKDRSGAEVISRLDETFLTKLAEAGGGRYVPLGPDGAGMASLLDADLRAIAKSSRATAIAERIEIFEWPLAVALVLFAAAAMLPRRRPIPATDRRGIAPAIAALAVALAIAPPAGAQEPSRAAEDMVRAGKAADALALLRDEILRSPDDPRMLYNYGLAAYAAGNFGVARTAWKQLSEGGDRPMVARCLFQLGNVEFKEGLALRYIESDARIAQLERAREYYLLAKTARAGSANENNLRVTTAELVRLHLESARGQVTSVERMIDRERRNIGALRSCVERLEAAIRHLESLLALEPNHAEAKALLEKARELLEKLRLLLAHAAKAELDSRMSKATPQSPDKTPLGDEKREKDLDRQAADLAKRAQEVVEHFDRAMETPKKDPDAERERAEVQKSAAGMLSDNAERHIRAADKRERATQQIEQLQQARGKLTEALEFTPENQPVQQKKTEVEQRIEQLAQRQARETLKKTEAEKAPQKMVGELGEARQNLSAASEIDPDDTETQQLQKQVNAKLAEAHEARGDEELAVAKQRSADEAPQAIAHAEQAVTDYGRAERFDKERAAKIEPKRAEALRQIDQLRAQLAKQNQANMQTAQDANKVKLPEIPSDLRDVQFQLDPRNGRDRQRAALLDTKDAPVLRDW